MALIQDLIGYVQKLVMPLVNNVVVAVLTFFIGLIVGRILGKVIHRVLHAFEVDKTLAQMMGAKVSVESLADVVVSYLTYFIFLIIALNQLGLTQWAIYAVAGIAGIIAVIATVMALKEIIPNAMCGYIVMRREFPRKGDTIRIDTVEGKVVEITLLETRVKTKKGDVISFPNRQILRGRIERLSKEKVK